jgi:hypothetical protein
LSTPGTEFIENHYPSKHIFDIVLYRMKGAKGYGLVLDQAAFTGIVAGVNWFGGEVMVYHEY